MKTTGSFASLAAIVGLATASAGCYRTRFELSPPQPELPSMAYSDHFQFSVIGVVEISRPVDLQAACNGAPPTAIEEQIGILGGIVNAALFAVFGVLHVHNATLYCPMGAPQGMQAPMYPGQPAPTGPQAPQGDQPPQGGYAIPPQPQQPPQ